MCLEWQCSWSPTITDFVPALPKDAPVSAKSCVTYIEDFGDNSERDGWCLVKSAENACASALFTERGTLEEIVILLEEHSNMSLGLREARRELARSLHSPECDLKLGHNRRAYRMESGLSDVDRFIQGLYLFKQGTLF